jgi:hypothetical protein
MMELVPYDPTLDYLFFGEEISMAARLFTHGGVFFSPPQTIIYHLWSRDHRPPPRAAVETEEKQEVKRRGQMRSQQLVLDMLRGRSDRPSQSSTNEGVKRDVEDSRYGLGTVRTISDYEQVLNLSFQELKIQFNDQQCGGGGGGLYSESLFAHGSALGLETVTPSRNSSFASSARVETDKTIKVLNLVQSFLI